VKPASEYLEVESVRRRPDPRRRCSARTPTPGIWTKAAALLQSVVKNQALIDGNKRLGWLSTAVFLELNGVATEHAIDDDVYETAGSSRVPHEGTRPAASPGATSAPPGGRRGPCRTGGEDGRESRRR
jgi:hypothetical protein